MDWKPIDQNMIEDRQDRYKQRKRTTGDKMQKIQLYVGTLEDINGKWLSYFQKIPPRQREREEKEYIVMTKDDQGILDLINVGKRCYSL